MMLGFMGFRRDMILTAGEAAVISRHRFLQPVGVILCDDAIHDFLLLGVFHLSVAMFRHGSCI